MPCESLAEFQELAKYRKSFNGDLQIAKSKPVKLVVLEGFQFEKGQKGLALVLGAVPTELMNQLKANAGKLKAAGSLAFGNDGLKVTVKSGKLADGDMKKALDLAQVKRPFTIAAAGAEREADETEDEGEAEGAPLPPKLQGAGEAFLAAQRALEGFFRERVAAMQWHEAEIRTQQDAQRKITEVQATIAGLRTRIADTDKKAKDLAGELKELKKDAQVSRYSKGQLSKLETAIQKQQEDANKLRHQIETQERKLPELELLAGKHGASRHGAQTDLGLQARRAATGGVTPDQSDNVHGVSEARVQGAKDHEVQLTELKWRRTKIKVEQTAEGRRKVVNATDVLKALVTDLNQLDRVATSTASKFHSHELEREAVQRAIDKVKDECVWTEFLDGTTWKPLETVTVYVGPPRKAAGWGMSVSRKSDAKKAVDDANKVLERYRRGEIDQQEMLDGLDVVMSTVEEQGRNGKTTSSVPMVKSARVTLGRTGSGWTSITHFPDPTATPPGWTLTGQFVRRDARSPQQTAPAGKQP